jgi:DNA-binding NarL/FixJ family response regulator
MIRVATLDRQPTAREGLAAVLRTQRDMAHIGAAATADELVALLERTQADVVVLDHRPGGDGLELCLQLRRRPDAPRVLVYATDMGPHAVVQGTLAGAAAIVDKAAPIGELLGAVRALASGERVLPAVTLPRQRRAAVLLCPRDRAIFAMRLARTPIAGIADVVGLHAAHVRARIAAIVAALDGVPSSRHNRLRAAA